MKSLAVMLAIIGFSIDVAASQPRGSATPTERERARIQNRLGWEHMQREEWTPAAQAFQRAIEIDASFELPYYGLGRAELGRKRYDAAIAALEKCSALYRAQAGRQFSNAQEAQRYRRDRMIEIDEQLRQLRSAPPSLRNQDLMRQFEDLKRDLQDRIERGNNINIENHIPAFVTLSLGSAYFRAGRFGDAEREYRATVAADPRSGEAFSNLAVVYLETNRFKDAAEAINAAKKTGFRVNPQLEQEINKRAKGR